MQKNIYKGKPLAELYLEGERYFLPAVSVDNVIFGFHDNELKVLLLHLAHCFMTGLRSLDGLEWAVRANRSRRPTSQGHRVTQSRGGFGPKRILLVIAISSNKIPHAVAEAVQASGEIHGGRT